MTEEETIKEDITKEENQKEEKQKSAFQEIVETIIFVLVAVILIRFFIGELRWIPSSSMYPTMIEGDRIFVEKVTMPFVEPKRGDVIVFYPPDEVLKKDFLSVLARLTGVLCKDIAYIKRIIGTPGDTLEIKKEGEEFFVYINGKKEDEPYIFSKTEWINCRDDMYCGPLTIPEDSYFMMGDNRGNSQDSRFWGLLPKKNIIGHAIFKFWPINRIGLIRYK